MTSEELIIGLNEWIPKLSTLIRVESLLKKHGVYIYDFTVKKKKEKKKEKEKSPLKIDL
jgi:hypothetical protein